MCSSGLKSVCFGAQSIALDQADLVVTGGFESMSKAPFLLFNVRWLFKVGSEGSGIWRPEDA